MSELITDQLEADKFVYFVPGEITSPDFVSVKDLLTMMLLYLPVRPALLGRSAALK